MALQGRTVLISGLPAGIDDFRLKDKLLIQFLRVCNGGGEIDSLSIVKRTSLSAVIIFQDSKVAQQVIHQKYHILDLDGRKYKLTAMAPYDVLDPNQVITSLSATVDYSQLPGGVGLLTNLCEKSSDVCIIYSTTDECCTLSGTYSKVQGVLTQLLGYIGSSQSSKKRSSVEKAASEFKGVKATSKLPAQESEDQNGNLKWQEEESTSDKKVNVTDSSTHNHLIPDDNILMETGKAKVSVENFSLIIDAALFSYLQKHCSEQYQRVLKQYDVCVRDVTNKGLTTLILQPSDRVERVSETNLKLAEEAIRRFYQKHESEIRQVQIEKNTLPSKADFEKIVENLNAQYPMVLVSIDNQYINIIGRSIDVLEVKHFFLKMKNKDIDSKPKEAYSPKHIQPIVEKCEIKPSSIGQHKTSSSKQQEKVHQRPNRSNLAPQFQGSQSADIAFRANCSSSGHRRPGPMLGLNVLSNPAKYSDEFISKPVSQNTYSDNLLKKGSTSPSSMLNSELYATSKSVTPCKTSQSSLTGSAALPPVVSKLKGYNSFSMMPQQKTLVMEASHLDDTSKDKVRLRATPSSFNSETNTELKQVHKAEITFSLLTWTYVKELYGARVIDLTSDVQMKENQLVGCTNVTLTLKGANKDKVTLCLLSLKDLVDLLSNGISEKKLYLSDLNVADGKDETLQACCSEMRKRFKKVLINFDEDSLSLIGPENLCSKLCATITRAFCER